LTTVCCPVRAHEGFAVSIAAPSIVARHVEPDGHETFTRPARPANLVFAWLMLAASCPDGFSR
jgi:hypothetical protein